MIQERKRDLAPEELERQDAHFLPDREEMAVIDPGLGPMKPIPIERGPVQPIDPPPELYPAPEPPTIQ